MISLLTILGRVPFGDHLTKEVSARFPDCLHFSQTPWVLFVFEEKTFQLADKFAKYEQVIKLRFTNHFSGMCALCKERWSLVGSTGFQMFQN